MANSIDFINRTVDPSLGKDIITACSNLSWALGDIDGRITLGAANRILIHLHLVSPGKIVMIDDSSIVPTLPPVPVPGMFSLPPDYPIPEVSRAAYTIYNQIKQLDPAIVAVESTEISMLDAMAPAIMNLPVAIQAGIAAMYLEGYAVYRDLLYATKETGLPIITKEDLTRLDTNLRWISSTVEVQTPGESLQVPLVMRDMQRTAAFIRYQDYLFNPSYNKILSNINQLRGVSSE